MPMIVARAVRQAIKILQSNLREPFTKVLSSVMSDRKPSHAQSGVSFATLNLNGDRKWKHQHIGCMLGAREEPTRSNGLWLTNCSNASQRKGMVENSIGRKPTTTPKGGRAYVRTLSENSDRAKSGQHDRQLQRAA
jgi:hypothetical protein